MAAAAVAAVVASVGATSTRPRNSVTVIQQPRCPVRDATASKALAMAERICYSSPGPARTTVADDAAVANSVLAAAARKADTRSPPGLAYLSVSVDNI